jgi:hypothetical protein
LSADLKTNLVSWYDLGDTSLGSELVDSQTPDVIGRGTYSSDLFTVDGGESNGYMRYDIPTTIAKTYTFKFNLTLGTSSDIDFRIRTSGDSDISTSDNINSSGEKTITCVPTTTTTRFYIYVNGSGLTATINDISAKEVLATDSQGSNDGSIYGATTTTGYTSSPHGVVDPINYGTLKSGTALSFDGTNDYVDTGDTFQTTFDGSFTISLWINPDDGQPTAYENMLGIYGDGSDRMHLQLDTGGQLNFRYKSNGNERNSTTSSVIFADGSTNWTYIVAVADSTTAGTGGMKLYIDGLETTLDNSDTSGITFADFATSTNLTIGARNHGTNGAENFYTGTMSNVKIFNSALTESEIQEMYLNPEQILPTGVSSSNLKLYLPMNEGDGTINYDGSGNQNHGTITGATWDTANTDIAQVGLVRQNKPMIFDGSDDYVAVDEVIGSMKTTTGTWSVWINNPDITSAESYFLSAGDTNADEFIILIKDTDGDLRAFLRDAGSNRWEVKTDSPAFTNNTWHHVVLTHNGTEPELYVDGSKPAQTFSVSTDKADWIADCTGIDNFRIGHLHKSSSAGGSFSGIMNEVAVWDTNLDADAVTALYNSGVPLLPTSDSGNYDNSGDLQGYWRNDGDTTWTDRSTNSNDGTASGSPDSIVLTEGLTSGRDSQGFYLTDTTENCLTLNGAEYVEIPDSEVLSFGDGTDDRPFSIEAWVNMEETSAFRILHKGNYNSTAEWGFEVSGNTLILYLYDESVSSTYESASVALTTTNTWIHVCSTYDGRGGTSANAGIKLYKDGVSQSLTLGGGGTYVAMENLSAPVYVGRYSTSYANGKIDDVRIYSKELSASEVEKNYNAGKSKHS